VISLFFGCLKRQDVKIDHNYYGPRTLSLVERKKRMAVDLFVYKKYKDLDGKDKVYVYKAD